MKNVQSTLAEEAMQRAAQYARIWKLDSHQIQDAVTVAWEMAQSGKGNSTTIALFAVRRVRTGRQFRQSVRSYDGPARRKGTGSKPRREQFDLDYLARENADPSRIAAFRIDFAEWLEWLPVRMRDIAESLGNGDTTSETAERFQVSPGRISQIRSELSSLWWEFHYGR